MFCAFLGNFYTQVTDVNNFLGYTLHLVAKYDGNLLLPIDSKTVQSHTVMHLLDAANHVTVLFELFYCSKRSRKILPID